MKSLQSRFIDFIIREFHDRVRFKQNLSVWFYKRKKGRLRILKRKYVEHLFYAIYTINPIPRWGEGGRNFPLHKFFLITYFRKNRIDLKILDFLSYTYMHPIQLQNFKFFIVSVQTTIEVDRNQQKWLWFCSGFWAIKATSTVNFFPFLYDCLVTFM